MDWHLECSDCGTTADAPRGCQRCARRAAGRWLVRYPARVHPVTERAEARRRHGMWRYRSFIPLTPTKSRSPSAKATRRCCAVPRLAAVARPRRYLGQGRRMQSDRVVQVARAERGDHARGARPAPSRFVVPTAGNAGVASAAYAARAGATVRVVCSDAPRRADNPLADPRVRWRTDPARRPHWRLRQGLARVRRRDRCDGPEHAARAIPHRREEDARSRARNAVQLDASRCDHLSHGRRYWPDRHVEGVHRTAGRGVGDRRASPHVHGAEYRLRTDRSRVRGGR